MVLRQVVALQERDNSEIIGKNNAEFTPSQAQGNQFVSYEEQEAGEEPPILTPKRGIANTYVWTADGGLHKTEQSYATQFSRSFSSFESHSNMAGVALDLEFTFPVHGFYAALDALGGKNVEIEVSSQVEVPAKPWSLIRQ